VPIFLSGTSASMVWVAKFVIETDCCYFCCCRSSVAWSALDKTTTAL
jgi:hypothetical protein